VAAVSAGRDKAAREKTAAAVAATPADTSKTGRDSDKAGGGAMDAKQVMGLSQDKFAALNEETLSRLRGDTL